MISSIVILLPFFAIRIRLQLLSVVKEHYGLKYP